MEFQCNSLLHLQDPKRPANCFKETSIQIPHNLISLSQAFRYQVLRDTLDRWQQ